MGNSYSAVGTCEILKYWTPRTIILLGIAGGNRHYDKHLRLGDIVVGTSVHAYEYQKIERVDGVFSRKREPREYHCTQSLVRAAGKLSVKINDTNKKKYDSDDERMQNDCPLIFLGVIASGGKLVADDDFMKDILKEGNRKIAAIEMEGEGVLVAAEHHHPKPDVIVIKGISDFADAETKTGGNRDDFREQACNAAANFVFKLLEEGLLHRA